MIRANILLAVVEFLRNTELESFSLSFRREENRATLRRSTSSPSFEILLLLLLEPIFYLASSAHGSALDDARQTVQSN